MLYAKLVYLHAMASTRLGDHQQGADELRSGLRVVTKAVYEDDELVRWRMQGEDVDMGWWGKVLSLYSKLWVFLIQILMRTLDAL